MAVTIHTVAGADPGVATALGSALRAAGTDIAATSEADDDAPQVLAVCQEVSAQTSVELAHLCRRPRAQIVVVNAIADPCAADAWQLLAGGADDVLPWTGDPAEAEAIAACLDRWAEVEELAGSPVVAKNLVGTSAAWRAALRDIVEVACFSTSSVLLTGETGTGKELATRLIHKLDRRPDRGELVVVDCTTIVESLSGSELFGHERGAFTGAASARDGAFGLADGGTLFLDEVGELPAELQAALLRVIQEGVYKRVGSDRWQRTSFRLVCATHRDLVADCAAGRFRSDLYFRIAASLVHLPPLRERSDDILPLAQHFLAQAVPDGVAPAIDPAVGDFLRRREYPGNVRELRQLLLRVLARYSGTGPLTPGLIPAHERMGDAVRQRARGDWRTELEAAIRAGLDEGVPMTSLAQATRDTAVRVALDEASGNVRRAAGRLGVSERALQLRRASERKTSASAD